MPKQEALVEKLSEITFWDIWRGFEINKMRPWDWRKLDEVRGEVRANLDFPVWGFRIRRNVGNGDGFSGVKHGTVENASEFPHLFVYGQSEFDFGLNLTRFRYQFLPKRKGEGEYRCFEFSSESLAQLEGIVSCRLNVETARLCALQVLGLSPHQVRGIKVEVVEMGREVTGKPSREEPNAVGFVFQVPGIKERGKKTVVVDEDGATYLMARDSNGQLLERLKSEILVTKKA